MEEKNIKAGIEKIKAQYEYHCKQAKNAEDYMDGLRYATMADGLGYAMDVMQEAIK